MSKPLHIAIIGAGATGLAAAFYLERAKQAGLDISYTLLERDERVGGKVAGEIVLDPESNEPYVVDGGPDCFSAYKPGGRRMTTLLGCENDWLPSNNAKKKVYVYRDGKMRELPEGFVMFVPTDLESLFETDLLSEEGKMDMIREMTIPPRDWSLTGQSKEGKGAARRDEAMGSFVERRFGKEVLDYIAEPFLGGVHASEPEDMSLEAHFPMYFDMEEKYGSVIRGTVEAKAMRKSMAAKAAAKADSKKKNIWGNTVFASYKLGMHQLTDAMAQHTSHSIRTAVNVESITRAPDNSYCLTLKDKEKTDSEGSEELQADAVIIATESYAGAKLTKSLDPEIAAAYEGIPNISTATVSFAFREDDLGESRNDGFGVLVPAVEERDLLAASWSSTKWPGRAPEGRVLIRGFVGTPKNQAVMDLSDEELTQLVLDELRHVMDLPKNAQPLFTRLYRWTLGMSQYKMGHLDRVETIEERSSLTPGLACAGGCFRGVGIPNCIDGGEEAARKVLADFDLEYSGE
ncbi:MAG: protoporphyrinogen oxidase [Coriobacteriia bacterium]|nr:protoporphyrinogen oxidase [Coriobacteriia bacterium]